MTTWRRGAPVLRSAVRVGGAVPQWRPFWANYPKPCDGGELLPEVKEAIKVIAKTKTRDSNGDLILATGHNSPEEDLMMIKEAVQGGRQAHHHHAPAARRRRT